MSWSNNWDTVGRGRAHRSASERRSIDDLACCVVVVGEVVVVVVEGVASRVHVAKLCVRVRVSTVSRTVERDHARSLRKGRMYRSLL